MVSAAIDVKVLKIYYFLVVVLWKKNKNLQRCTRKHMETLELELKDHASIIGVLIQRSMCLVMEKDLNLIKLATQFILSVLRKLSQRQL